LGAEPLDSAVHRQRISIITLLWRNESYALSFLKTLSEATRLAGATVEVVAVENGSDGRAATEVFEGQLDALPELQLSIVHEPTNRGFAGGANVGCEKASGDIMVVANLDLEFDQHFVVALLRAAGMLASACLLVPSVMTPRRNRRSADDPDSAMVLSQTGPVRRGPFHQPRGLRQALAGGERVQLGNGSCLIFGRRLYRQRRKAVGGLFDPEYHSYYEDVDLYWWAESSGVPARFHPDLKVLHYQGGSFGGQYRFVERTSDVQRSVMANYRITVWKNLRTTTDVLRWLAGECGYVVLSVRNRGLAGLGNYGASWALAASRCRAIRNRRGSLRATMM
jgi:GT2 family glycosyltransferase